MSTETAQAKTLPAVLTADSGTLHALVEPASHVLLEFEGPLTRLLPRGRAAEAVAREVRWLEAEGLGRLLTARERAARTPGELLAALAAHKPGSDLLEEIEQRLVQAEVEAAATAVPTPFADPLVRRWNGCGARLLAFGGHAPEAIRAYLAERGLAGSVDPRVFGRLSPNSAGTQGSSALRRALDTLGVPPDSVLVLGESPQSAQEARESGLPFLGYAPTPDRAEALAAVGELPTVATLEPVLHVVRARMGG